MMHQTPAASEEPFKVALLGCGVVGSQVARLLLEQGDDLRSRIGRPLELVGIAVNNLNRPRPGGPTELLTDDAHALVARDDLDIVIEVIGGVHPATELLLTAINNGASVVTANKALLAEEGQQIIEAAERMGVDVYYEAAVAGAIPIIRPLRESLVGDQIKTVMGIVNGTTNYILDKMSAGNDYGEALAEAQRLGFAETDPTADVEGFDAAAKTSILASLAFHTRIKGSQVYREGITGITQDDIRAARAMGCVVKLVGIAEVLDDGSVNCRVHPAMIPLEHPLASISGANNAIVVEATEAGRLMFFGPGAGGAPTASAVVGDLVTVARNRHRGVAGPLQTVYTRRQAASMAATKTRYFVRFRVADEPGILAAAATIFAEHRISVEAVQQYSLPDQTPGEDLVAVLGMMTHQALEVDMMACLADLQKASFVQSDVSVMRVEGK